MNELVCMLVPLETLPGWPEVNGPTPLQSLGLLVGIPLLITLIIFGIGQLGSTRQSSSSDRGVTESTWVGASPSGGSGISAGEAIEEGRAPAPAVEAARVAQESGGAHEPGPAQGPGEARAGEAQGPGGARRAAPDDPGTGGASARW